MMEEYWCPYGINDWHVPNTNVDKLNRAFNYKSEFIFESFRRGWITHEEFLAECSALGNSYYYELNKIIKG